MLPMLMPLRSAVNDAVDHHAARPAIEEVPGPRCRTASWLPIIVAVGPDKPVGTQSEMPKRLSCA